MSSHLSFVTLLRKYCDLIKPKKILEWGPGKSTWMMREITDADIMEGRIKNIEDKRYLELCNSLQDMQEKIMFINKTLFKNKIWYLLSLSNQIIY